MTPVISSVAQTAERLAPSLGATVNRGDSDLHDAVLSGSLEVLNELLAAGADPNIRNNSGSTPLHYAASQNNINAIKALLAAGADPLLPNKAGLTAVEIGVFMGSIGSWGT